MDIELINGIGISEAGQHYVERETADFDSTIRVEFEDGSTMIFNDAECWVDERLTIIRTEHCGEHVIPHAGTLLIERLERHRSSPVLLSTDLLAPGFTIEE